MVSKGVETGSIYVCLSSGRGSDNPDFLMRGFPSHGGWVGVQYGGGGLSIPRELDSLGF